MCYKAISQSINIKSEVYFVFQPLPVLPLEKIELGFEAPGSIIMLSVHFYVLLSYYFVMMLF